MAHAAITAVLLSILFFELLLNSYEFVGASQSSDRKLHIVYLGDIPSHVEGDFKSTAAAYHHDMLESVIGSHEEAHKHLEYSYGKSFNGFAAWLSPSEVQHISNMRGVLSVFESRTKIPLTTRSWDFMGFPQTVKRNFQHESDIIVGLLDTGIWPESKSFSDTGLSPIPSKWKGECQTTSDFKACNRKLIGARFYDTTKGVDPSVEFLSPRDWFGHGSHTSSTAAGNVVKNASYYGVAEGDARGGVPGARIAMYKVCWRSNGCPDADILAAFDDAIHDGVDVLSLSIGSDIADYRTLDYFEDSVAIGAFHAMKKGILVSNSAGNSGNEHMLNFSPWSLTVAASTIDRQFITPLLLGNNISFKGVSLNTFSMEQPWYPLIYAGDATNVSGGYSWNDSRNCVGYSLDRSKVEGKIVLCDGTRYAAVVIAGGAGAITTSDSAIAGHPPEAFIPQTALSTADANHVKLYINSSGSPLAIILKSITPNYDSAPILAGFSSRGPNPITPGILKPDITAPGVYILAAWAQITSTDSDYNIISGTSMSCPHVAGAAAYVKSIHPDWSPAAIKSALMTTANPLDTTLDGNQDAEFGYGAGHIDPVKATDPGLVYDADVNSYTNFLCSQGYNSTVLRLLTGGGVICLRFGPKHIGRGARRLNYPSMTVVARHGKPFSVMFPRTVTNVGPPQSNYKAIVDMSSGVKVTVEPDTLSFTSVQQELSYTVKVEGGSLPEGAMIGGSLTWKYGDYNVRSPIVVYRPYHTKRFSKGHH